LVLACGDPVVLRDSIAGKVGLQLLERSVVLRKRVGAEGLFPPLVVVKNSCGLCLAASLYWLLPL
jgi:hypothetical protein